MKKLNDIKQNINKKKITVLGGGVSGIGAATLANFLGAKVLLSNDKKETSYKFPLLHKLPYVGEKLFTSNGVIERKTDLIIQITPTIVKDGYSNILKNSNHDKVENSLDSNKEAPSE